MRPPAKVMRMLTALACLMLSLPRLAAADSLVAQAGSEGGSIGGSIEPAPAPPPPAPVAPAPAPPPAAAPTAVQAAPASPPVAAHTQAPVADRPPTRQPPSRKPIRGSSDARLRSSTSRLLLARGSSDVHRQRGSRNDGRSATVNRNRIDERSNPPPSPRSGSAGLHRAGSIISVIRSTPEAISAALRQGSVMASLGPVTRRRAMISSWIGLVTACLGLLVPLHAGAQMQSAQAGAKEEAWAAAFRRPSRRLGLGCYPRSTTSAALRHGWLGDRRTD